MLRVSVSSLDLYRQFCSEEDYPLSVLIQQLKGEGERTPAMERGGAFAKAMEHVGLGESSTISAEGHTFAFTCDAEIEAWPRREEKREKDYGGIVVSARCDRIMGRIIADDKTTSKFDAEAYQDRFQWRFYLDLFDADVFRWHVWEVAEMTGSPLSIEEQVKRAKPTVNWEVYAHHLLTQYRYPDLEKDCRELALDFRQFIVSNRIESVLERSARVGSPEPRKPQETPSSPQPWRAVTDPNGQLLGVKYDPVNGIFRCRWRKGEGFHTGVPEEVFVTIQRVPFAYSYYQKKVKGQYPYTKVD